MNWLSGFFLLSGLCSIVYELVWLRLAMAKFGVTTALVSIVLSVFMAGLGLGSLTAGWLLRRLGDRINFAPLRLYGLLELLIGISALIVPLQFTLGGHLLERWAGHVSISSGTYYLLSGAWLALTMIPWCACMGATIPVAMFAIRQMSGDWRRSFSFLYVANVMGAVGGACATPFLIELYGFHGTLRRAAILNVLIFASAMVLSVIVPHSVGSGTPDSETTSDRRRPVREAGRNRGTVWLLFASGLVTMGMEVVWIRLFTFFIGPLVYSFATILAAYLVATFAGSMAYRRWSRRGGVREIRLLWASLALLGLLPLLTSDSRIAMNADVRVFLGVMPFAAVIGFLTPMLIDRWSEGDANRAGRAYTVNIAGCIAGPLVAGFVFLPLVGERVSMLLLVLPWIGMAMFGGSREERPLQTACAAGLVIAALTVFFFTRDYESLYVNGVTLRDSSATVIASGEGPNRLLLVNGIGMTLLTPVTKMMAHFTAAHLPRPPRNALVICFGMGTTFRSALSWGIPVTVVELVPSVPKLFGYFHADAEQTLASPNAHVVIDDGRRFLERSTERFDMIIVDPPPPIEAAGSSLLYSREFYSLVREHLAPGGILQQWIFQGDDADKASTTKALLEVFPYVRIYGGLNQIPGHHCLASMSPIPERTAERLVAQMPAAAVTDMMQWGPAQTAEAQFQMMLDLQASPQDFVDLAPLVPALEDDRPVNEYYRLRTLFPGRAGGSRFTGQ